MLPHQLGLLAAATAFGTASAGGSVFAANPFKWDLVSDKLYSFCSNASGALAPDALAALSKSKIMIHGMEEGAALPPAWKNSEAKIGLAAAQLRALNPAQLQLYTVQIDYARSVYTSGQWFYEHPECLNRDSNGALMNHTGGNTSLHTWTPGHCDFGRTGPTDPYPGHCPVYGFQTECGRKNWVSLIVKAVTDNKLDGVFIDGFQGCAIDDAHPTGGCCPGGSKGSQCSTAQKSAWMLGLREALWALKKAFAALKKTIICNKTGGTYACGTDSTKCWCDASNSERFGGGPGGVVSLTDYHKLNPLGGVIVHVPHINGNSAIFYRALAAFLLGAYDGYGFGIGFQYECGLGGWLESKKFAYALDQRLGEPKADVNISVASWPGANCTYTTPARPKPCPPGSSKQGCLETIGCMFSRSFESGTTVFMGQYKPPVPFLRPQNGGLCIWWADGTLTGNASLCPPKQQLI